MDIKPKAFPPDMFWKVLLVWLVLEIASEVGLHSILG